VKNRIGLGSPPAAMMQTCGSPKLKPVKNWLFSGV